MKTVWNKTIDLLARLCQNILKKIDEYKEKEQKREFVSKMFETKHVDCSDANALDFCIQQVQALAGKYSIKETPGRRILVVNGVLLADFIKGEQVKSKYRDISENEIRDIAHSCLIICQEEESVLETLKVNCTEDGVKSLNEFFQGKGFVSITK